MKIKRLTLTTVVSASTRIVLTIFATLLKSKERVNINFNDMCVAFLTQGRLFFLTFKRNSKYIVAFNC